MQIPATILTAAQRKAMRQIERLLQQAPARISLWAPPAHGITHLMQSLVSVQGMGKLATEFIYVATPDSVPQDILLDYVANPKQTSIGFSRTVLLVDSPLTSDQATILKAALPLGTVLIDIANPTSTGPKPANITTSSTTGGTATVPLIPLTRPEIESFCAAHQLTLRGKRVRLTDIAIDTLHETTGGITGPLIEALASALKAADAQNTSRIDSGMIKTRFVAPRSSPLEHGRAA